MYLLLPYLSKIGRRMVEQQRNLFRRSWQHDREQGKSCQRSDINKISFNFTSNQSWQSMT